jgi:hypothetical protein
MHHITRRLSPSLIIAIVALFAALTGTAAAAVIIKSPDELGDDVVTGRAIDSGTIVSSDIANESIVDNDLGDPQLKVRVLGSEFVTKALSGSDGTVARVGEGAYNVTFNVGALNASGKTDNGTLLNNNCAFTATARNKRAIMSIDDPLAGSPNTLRVRAVSPGTNGQLEAVDSSFDVFASC